MNLDPGTPPGSRLLEASVWRRNACGFSLGPLKGYLLHPRSEAAPEGAACSPPKQRAGPGICVSSRVWRPLTLAQAARAVPRLLSPCLHLPRPPHPIPSAPGFSGDASKSICSRVCSARKPGCRGRQGRSPDAWLVGWLAAPATQVSVSDPVRVVTRLKSREEPRGPAGGSCVCRSHAGVDAGCPVGSGEKAGARQSTAREAVYSQRNGILRPRSLRRVPAGGPCPAPTDGASWNLLTGSLPLGGEAEGGGSRRGSSSPMPGPRGGARRDLRRPLLAAVGRAWLTRGAALYPPDGVKAADHTHFQRDIRPCRLTEIRDDPRADAAPPSPPTRSRVSPSTPAPSCPGRENGRQN